MTDTDFDTCKDCDEPTDGYVLAKHRGRCASCFDEYGDLFKQAAEVAFVNHVLTLSRGEAREQDRARAWRDRYWSELKQKEGDAHEFCGHQCLRASDIGLGGSPAVSGDPVAYPHPDCDIHGLRVQYSRPELARLVFRAV
jgi:hypothetical protein